MVSAYKAGDCRFESHSKGCLTITMLNIYSRSNSFSIWIRIKRSKSYFEQKEVHKTNVTWQTSYLFYFNVKFYVIPKKLFYELCFYKYIIAIRQFLRWQSFWKTSFNSPLLLLLWPSTSLSVKILWAWLICFLYIFWSPFWWLY